MNYIISHAFKLGNHRKGSVSESAQVCTRLEMMVLSVSVLITILMVLCFRFILGFVV